MTFLQIAALVWSLQSSSIAGDALAAVAHPSPAAIVQFAADVAGVVAAVNPHAKVAAIALGVAALMLRHPSDNPIGDMQTHLARGGRRG